MIPAKVYEQTIRGFFAPITPYLDDEKVSEIMINSFDRIYVERAGLIEGTDAAFANEEELFAAIRNLAQYVGRHFDSDNPVLEARFPDGSRVEAIMPPAAPEGPAVAIRRFSKNTLTIDRLVSYNSMTREAAETLQALVAGKQNIVVAGGTASGKTSMLNAMSGLIPKHERIVTIEDARELQLQQPHVVPLEAQTADAKGRGRVSIRDLFKATLRMRPDRIIVGEIRGGEALDLIQSLTSGHGGGMTTVHASHSLDTLNRLETMAMMSDVEMPLYALRCQVASAVNFVVHVSRLADGSRCVTQITEVRGFDPKEGYELVDIFRRDYVGRNNDGTIISEFGPTGELPSCHEYLSRLGHRLPNSLYDKVKAAS